jgi:hypothetical protein
MRNLFWQMSVTLDGFMEGPNQELLKSIDGILIGRRTYELFQTRNSKTNLRNWEEKGQTSIVSNGWCNRTLHG